MEHNIELRLIKSLTDREIYEGCVGLVRPDLFSDDLEDIMSAIQELHSEFDSGIDIDTTGVLTPFEKEFLHQRNLLGPGMIFEWNGSLYTTDYK